MRNVCAAISKPFLSKQTDLKHSKTIVTQLKSYCELESRMCSGKNHRSYAEHSCD